MLKELDVLLRDSRIELFRRKEQLQVLKSKVKDSVAHLSRSKSTINNMCNRLRVLGEDIKKQQSTVSGQASKC